MKSSLLILAQFIYITIFCLPLHTLAIGQEKLIVFQKTPNSFQLAGSGTPGEILVDGKDHWGVLRAASDLAIDFGRVSGDNLTLQVSNADYHTGKYDYFISENMKQYVPVGPRIINGPQFKTHGASSKTVIIAGTAGKSLLIDQLIATGKIDISPIVGKWEAYLIQVVIDPLPNVPQALVIVGSDKRGTIYGIYEISEQIGVSPFYWWADVHPQKHLNIYAMDLSIIRDSPSVKYRGFFVNDEAPALTNWIYEKFATSESITPFNRHFYKYVFELLLRLRANYLWPAMWASNFNSDDLENQPLADAYGIVMGTSHTEPLLRACHEWPVYGDGVWQWDKNKEGIAPYFEYGVRRAKHYEGIYNLAMRGYDDFEMDLKGDAAIKVLLDVVDNQREILSDVIKKPLDTIPQMWCIYKEVQGYYENGMSIPDDVIILWSDDNWGNVRRVPLESERERSGGAGLYYHFDYVGDPRDYKWINTISLQRTWEQLNLAHQYGADQVWIVNVGDIKPLEIPISFYFDVAYDKSRWNQTNIRDWLQMWATREFGDEFAKEIASIIDTYSQYSAWRKYELVDMETLSIINYEEADNVERKWNELLSRAEVIYEQLQPAMKPSYFQMILHPIKAGSNLYSIYIDAARNLLFSEQRRTSANKAARRVLDLFKRDKQITNEYHSLLGGKWNHMMDQTHLGYSYWQQPMRDALPPLHFIQEETDCVAGGIGIGVPGSYAAIPGDDRFHELSGRVLDVPVINPFAVQKQYVDIFSRETGCTTWELISSDDYVTVFPSAGTACGSDEHDTRSYITVDWLRAPAGASVSYITLSVTSDSCSQCPDHRRYGGIKIKVPLQKDTLPEGFANGFAESDGHISIEAEHISRNSSLNGLGYITIPNFGHTLSGVTLSPVVCPTQDSPSAPTLEYDFVSFTDSPANITIYTAPSLNFLGRERPLKYRISVDDNSPSIVQVVPLSYEGTLPEGWEEAVANNVWKTSSIHVFQPGKHTLKLAAIEPGLTFQKIVLDFGGVRASYFGPPESMRILKQDRESDPLYAISSAVGIPIAETLNIPEGLDLDAQWTVTSDTALLGRIQS
ncbi:hypothetical protein V1511DRAFT_503954 [Dipodascopsis uninucleata]